MVQVMKYHEWPPAGVGDFTHDWDGDQTCGGAGIAESLYADFSDPYDWESMPDSCDLGCTPEEEEAIAELCYEVGVAIETDFGKCVSAASWDPVMTAFRDFFLYDPAVGRDYRYQHTLDSWFQIIQTEINEDRPIMYTYWNVSWGHEIVCDGWREVGGLKQYHMNYGWAGPYTGWYTLDSLHGSANPQNESIIRNIEPDQTQVYVTVADEPPAGLLLAQNAPNPFNALTEIAYTIPGGCEASPVLLRVYDSAGRLVRTLVEEPKTSGVYLVRWDGKGRKGQPVASGVYFCQLSWAGQVETGRMVLVR
jgi:hypothetical protein